MEAKKTLISKLVKVMAGVSRIPKNGFNKFHNYAYATESDVSDHIRSALAEQNVFFLSSVEEISSREIKTKAGNTEAITRVKIKFTFLCGETGENFDFFGYGEGQDAGDKGVYKAITGATKYALMKSFLIPTGDDPEVDTSNGKTAKAPTEKPPKPESPQQSKPQPQAAKSQPQPTAGSKNDLMQAFNNLRIGMVEQYWQYVSSKYKAMDWTDLSQAEIEEQQKILSQAKADQIYRDKFVTMLKAQQSR